MHKLQDGLLKTEMDDQRKVVHKNVYKEATRPVYILSNLYEDISSDEEEFENQDLINEMDFREDISLESGEQIDENFVDNIISEMREDDVRLVEVADEDEGDLTDSSNYSPNNDYNDEKMGGNESNTSSSSDSDDNVDYPVGRAIHSIGLNLKTTLTRFSSGNEEITRETDIIYSEDIDPQNIDLERLVSEIFHEVPRHFADRNFRFMKGNFKIL